MSLPAGARRPYRGRYAPSPTGGLHLGNARTALVAWLRARSARGTLVLRVDDLDGPRTVPEAVQGNLEELRWLGLDWDEGPDVGGPHGPYLQSRRGHLYAEALETLERRGLVFPCYLSRRELAGIASAPHGRAPVYGAAERRANDRIAARRKAEGRTPSLRLRAPLGAVAFEDAVAGPSRYVVGDDVGDVVVRRSDGLWAYHLATVVDDAAMGVTEVVRGDDLLPSSASQLLLYDALGLTRPDHAHVPLLLGPDGRRLAKRRGSLTLGALREAGVAPQRVVGLLAHGLGLLPRLEPSEPRSLIGGFTLGRLSRAPAVLGQEERDWLLSRRRR